MSLEEEFNKAEAYYQARAWWETWGHPEANVKYPGWMIIGVGFSEAIVIDEDWGEFDGGPWFYDDQSDFLSKKQIDKSIKSGYIYIFKGYYIKYGTGSFRFVGRIKEIKASDLRT